MGWDDLIGVSTDPWGRVGRREGDGADVASRQNILAASERDLERKRARDSEPVVPMRWRRHRGAWQRWSELDGAFATMDPPGTLEEHVAAAGLPADDEELVFVGGAWKVADDHLGSPDDEDAPPDMPRPGPAPEPVVTAAPPPAPPPPARQHDEAEFQRQLEAWRTRR